MKQSLLQGLALGMSLSAAVSAQQAVRPFPLQQNGADTEYGASFTPQLEQIQLLGSYDELLLTGVPTGEGEVGSVDLTRVSIERRGFGFYVDGRPRPGLLDGLDLTVWKGSVVGQPGSEVLLSFSNQGSRGWITNGDDVQHFIARPDADGSWTHGDVLVISEAELNQGGMYQEQFCGTERALPPLLEAVGATPQAPPTNTYGGTCGLKECTIAVETDWQLNQVFGGLAPMTAYMGMLLTAISDRYEGQIGTVLTFPYLQFYSNSNDPWSTPDTGGSTIDMLDEFRGAWLGNIPTGATLAHFISGASLGGGVAYLDVLCNSSFAFGVSANLGGDVSFPIQQQSGNWDFMVIAHELGHNFAAPHTHDLGIDDCAGGSCITNGTIMSYCHLCPGGTANITTFFHPTNVATMTNAANNCLPDFGGGTIAGENVNLLSDQTATTVSAQILGSPIGTVDLNYRYNGGSFTAVAMTDLGGGLYEADLPAANCDANPEYFFSFDSSCGQVTDPSAGNYYSPEVGTASIVFADNFEADTGWTPTNLGATTGDWQRGVPVNDGGWDHDPTSDFDGSGSAYLTQNENGNTDVDNGAVRLETPDLDLTNPDSSIAYAYYLRLTNDDGTDALIVEANSGGAWIEVARHDTDGGLSWRTHLITGDDLASAGVTPSANARLRFTVNDGDAQSIVEAGIDAFEILTVECGDGDLGSNYCVAADNSTGFPAVMSASGSASVAANDLVLEAGGVPSFQNGIFYYGPDQILQPFGNGFRCVGGSQVYRLAVETADGLGLLSHAVDNTAPPQASGQLLPGATWNFQAWYRDALGGGAFFNLSDGYTITFQP